MLGSDGGDGSEDLKFGISATLAALTSGYSATDTEPMVITWEALQHECREDKVMVILIEQIRRGFPDSGYDGNPAIKEFHRYSYFWRQVSQ